MQPPLSQSPLLSQQPGQEQSTMPWSYLGTTSLPHTSSHQGILVVFIGHFHLSDGPFEDSEPCICLKSDPSQSSQGKQWNQRLGGRLRVQAMCGRGGLQAQGLLSGCKFTSPHSHHSLAEVPCACLPARSPGEAEPVMCTQAGGTRPQGCLAQKAQKA